MSCYSDPNRFIMVWFAHLPGSQVPDAAGREKDGKDECICPTDMNVMVDDDLRRILKKLPDGVKFTMIADCCHSGTMLDHQEVQIAGNKDPNAPEIPDLGSLGALFGFKGAAQDVGDRGIKNRSDGLLFHLHFSCQLGLGSEAKAWYQNLSIRPEQVYPSNACLKTTEHVQKEALLCLHWIVTAPVGLCRCPEWQGCDVSMLVGRGVIT